MIFFNDFAISTFTEGTAASRLKEKKNKRAKLPVLITNSLILGN
jgi:hypothetical protein